MTARQPGENVSFEQAERLIAAAVHAIDRRERVELDEALERVAAASVVAGMDAPQLTNSAVDGYALSARDLPAAGTATVRIVGVAVAGRIFKARIDPGTCVRIMTGAALPPGADTVVMQEHVNVEGDKLVVGSRHRPHENVRQAGEDVTRGNTVLPAGAVVTPHAMGLLATVGINTVEVYAQPTVVCLRTGDELRPLGSPLADGGVYDSNRYLARGLLQRLGLKFVDAGIAADTPEALSAKLRQAALGADAVITSGGVSVGDTDYLRDALDAIGELHFAGVAIKPGRPFAFGTVPSGPTASPTPVFALPGNPVAFSTTLQMLVAPALQVLAGARPSERVWLNAECQDALGNKPGRREFLRGTLELSADGRHRVFLAGPQGSGILSSMTRANCFIVIDAGAAPVAAGQQVKVLPFYAHV